MFLPVMSWSDVSCVLKGHQENGGGMRTHNHKAINDMECDALVSYVCAYHDVRLV